MYEYHAWLVLQESPRDVDEGGLELIVEKVEKRVKELGDVRLTNPFATMQVINGVYRVLISGTANHRGPDAEEVFSFLRFVATVAPGSYGLLHVWDDEDPDGFENEFRAWVLARGNLKPEKDRHLSPCVPKIEDAG